MKTKDRFKNWIISSSNWYYMITSYFLQVHMYLVYYFIYSNVFWNAEGAFCSADEPSIRTIPCDLTTQPCGDCYDKYDKCDKIATSYCTDVRYADQLERLCQNHCGHCSSRKRRRRRRIQNEDNASYKALDALLKGDHHDD